MLRHLTDVVRSGASLRQSILRCAGDEGSPLVHVATALAAGRPLAAALRDAMADAPGTGGDADVSSAFCILAVHAEAGGDPLPALRSLAAGLARRRAARDEARALTTQARLGARAMLVLTPAFLVLVGLSDPHGAARWFTDGRTRAALIVGVLLQVLG